MPSCVPWDPDIACCEDWDTLAPEIQERATKLAWVTMRALTGGQIGNCPVMMRPCLTAPCDWCAQEWMTPVIRDGRWYNIVCGTPRCSCVRMCEIVFPGPIAALISVQLDGQELSLEGDYRVDNGNRLVRQDGECWPSCQDMGKHLGDPGTLGITYVPGIEPDASALWATGVMACEFSKACTGGKCRLPSSVTQIARQGVAFTISAGMFENGMTGIREVDAYLSAVNPHAIKTPSMVWSPDVPWAQHRYQTWPTPVAPTP